MVLTDLHSLTSAVHRGGIPVLVQYLGQLAGHILYRFALFYEGAHICNETPEADLGKALNGLRPADVAKRRQGIRGQIIVGVAELRSATIGEAEVFGWSPATRAATR